MRSSISARQLWLTLAILCVALPAAAAPPAAAADWPKYRRDRLQSAVSTEKLQLPLTTVWYFRSRLASVAPKYIPIRAKETQRFGASSRELLPGLVRYALTVTSAGDLVFFTSHDGRVVCLDAKTGELRWEFVAGGAIECSANIVDGKVYVGSDDGYVYCLDAKTGALAWKHKSVTADKWLISFGRMSSIWPVRTDVLVEKGVAYFGSGIFPHEGMFVNALDVKTRQRTWRTACYGFGLAGHVFLSKSVVVLPTELKGFHGKQLMFRRTGGGLYRDHWGPEIKANTDLLHSGGGGAVVDGVRYTTDYSTAIMARDTKDNKNRWLTRVSGMLFDPRQTAYAGGVFYALGNAYGRSPAGGGGGVYAVDPKGGKVLWSAQIPERAHHLAIANGRLFVSTRQGSIYCYAAKGTPAVGVIDEPVESVPFAKHKDRGRCAEAVRRMLAPKKHPEQGLGIEGKGFALVFDCTDGLLPFELAKQTDLYVCAVFDDEAKAQRAREVYTKANVHCSRISVFYRKPGARLPYPPRFADLILSEQAIVYGRMPTYTAELERLLKPRRGVVLIGGRERVTRDGKQVKVPVAEWAKSKQAKPEVATKPAWEVSKPAHGQRWARHSRPALANAGGWTHANGTSGNTMCSQDSALKAPLGIAWYGPPHTSTMFDRPPRVLNGVMVCPIDQNTLEAYDVYNGRKLWSYNVPRHKGRDGGRTIRMFALGGDSVFIPDGNADNDVPNFDVLRLDLWTGKVVQRYPEEHRTMLNGTFAVSPDGKMFWRSGFSSVKGQAQWGGMYGKDAETGKIVWMAGGPGKKSPFGTYPHFPYTMWSAIADGRVFIMGNVPLTSELRAQQEAEMKAYLKASDPEALKNFKDRPRKIVSLTACDAKTGKVLYTHAVDVAGCASSVAAHNGKVIFVNHAGEKWWGGFGSGAFKRSQIAVHDAATGKLLWKRECNYRFAPVITDDTIYAEPWVFDLATGKKKQRSHPITGVKSDYAWVRHGKQCGGYNGSTYLLFGRSKGFGYFDALRDRGFYTSWHHRQSCSIDTASGSGMMIKPPFNAGCGCPWSLPYTMAMTNMPDEPAIPYTVFQAGASVPAKELRINFGASGDRKDKAGNVWLNPAREQHPSKLQLRLRAVITYYGEGVNSHGGANTFSRHSASDVPAENTTDPFLFDAYGLGLQRCAVPVTTPADGKGTYTVRLGFSALPGDKLGQRVFDVRLNGKTVLKDFDIVKTAGKPHRAVWKEFTIDIDGGLILDLVSSIKNPKRKNMPLINAMEILRKKFAAFGLKAPPIVWVNERKPETFAEIRVANHRSRPFTGKLVINARGGLVATLPDGGALTLAADEEKSITVAIKNTQPAKTGSHELTIELLSAAGKVVRQGELIVDCLGKLERLVVRRGSGRWCMTRKTYDKWRRHGSPAYYVGRFPASQGGRKPGDLGAAGGSIKFWVPPKVGKIHRLRVRLRVSHEMQAGWRAMFGSANDARPPSGGWGRFRIIDSDTDVNVNSLNYPKLAKLLPVGYTLAPTRWDQDVIEAQLPTNLKRDKSGQGYVQLILEGTAVNGPVYCGPAGHNVQPGDGPKLVIDYEPVLPKK